jgi:lipoic acid synthetase
VAHGKPATLDIDEPRRVGEAVEKMALKYAVITSVDRDDLPTAAPDFRGHDPRHQAAAARVPRRSADSRLQGRAEPLEIVLRAKPDVLNHNTETVPRLYRAVRSGGATRARSNCSIDRGPSRPRFRRRPA